MNVTVMFVDDDQGILDSLKRSLRKEPYKILTAQSGEEALEILATESIDVVVSDENMPGMGGSAFLKEVRVRYPSTIRIMLTGAASVESAMNAIYEGWVYQYLHKPVKASDLASAIHYGILIRSLHKDGEDPHLIMSAQEQDSLLDRISQRASQAVSAVPENQPAKETPVEVLWAIRKLSVAVEEAKHCGSVDAVTQLIQFTLDNINTNDTDCSLPEQGI